MHKVLAKDEPVLYKVNGISNTSHKLTLGKYNLLVLTFCVHPSQMAHFYIGEGMSQFYRKCKNCNRRIGPDTWQNLVIQSIRRQWRIYDASMLLPSVKFRQYCNSSKIIDVISWSILYLRKLGDRMRCRTWHHTTPSIFGLM